VKGHDDSLAQAISTVEKVIGEVNTQAKQVEKEIHVACEKLREMVNEREAQLLGEVETVRHEKEKELVSQKHHLEFLLVGIRESAQFGEALVNEGSENEIVASQKEVVSRLTSLGQEKEKSQMEPVTDSTIVFEGDEGGLREVGVAIKVFGNVVRGLLSRPVDLFTGLSQRRNDVTAAPTASLRPRPASQKRLSVHFSEWRDADNEEDFDEQVCEFVRKLNMPNYDEKEAFDAEYGFSRSGPPQPAAISLSRVSSVGQTSVTPASEKRLFVHFYEWDDPQNLRKLNMPYCVDDGEFFTPGPPKSVANMDFKTPYPITSPSPGTSAFQTPGRPAPQKRLSVRFSEWRDPENAEYDEENLEVGFEKFGEEEDLDPSYLERGEEDDDLDSMSDDDEPYSVSTSAPAALSASKSSLEDIENWTWGDDDKE